MGGVEEIKRVMNQTIRDSDQISKLKVKQESFISEIIKINENFLEIQNVVKAELSNPNLVDFKDLISRVGEIEDKYKYFKATIDELKGDEVITSVDRRSSIKGPNSAINNINSSSIKGPAIRRGSLVKDFVLELNMSIVNLNEKVEELSTKFDSINQEILERIKRDLTHDSNKILDEFRLDLKFSISKIEEQMREKVDKFNMEEFTRKFEKKMLLEINSKIDRVDLKKNNTLINRKVYHL